MRVVFVGSSRRVCRILSIKKINAVHALTLISRTGKMVRRCLYIHKLRPLPLLKSRQWQDKKYHSRMRIFSYAGHFRSRDKDGGHTFRSAIYANFIALCFIDPELLPMEVLHCENRDFRHFCFCDLDLTRR